MTASHPAMFAWLQRRLLWNGLRSLVSRQRIRLVVIAVLSVVIWTGLFLLFVEGFSFLRGLDNNGPISNDITALLFGLFFLSVAMLAVFSGGLMLFGSLFRQPEAWFLMASPARADRIFAYKFRETLLLTGWPFLLLGTPLLLAYGLVMHASWLYYLVFPFYLVGFLLLPGAVGAILCLVIVAYASRHRKLVLGLLVTAFVLVVLIWVLSAAQGVRSDILAGLPERWARRVIDHLQPTRAAPPGAWLTEGLLAAAQVRGTPRQWWAWYQGELPPEVELDPDLLRDAIHYLVLTWAWGLAAYWLATFMASRLYRRAFDQIAGAGDSRRKQRQTLSDRLVSGLVSWRDEQTRLFVLKDWRTFRRDPSQWGQVLLLGTIILLYLANIQNLPHSKYPMNQRAMIGLLNVGVIGLMMATFTSRFVFPLMSLEGRNFWILGLLPLKRERLLTSKFTYAATFTLVISLGFVLISGWQLRLPLAIIFMHLLSIVVLALGLSALSVGLGAYLVNVKETNPSKIATGFGGTINLLVSLGFSIVVIALAGLPSLVYFLMGSMKAPDEEFDWRLVAYWQVGCLLLLLLAGVLTVWLPLRLGMRAFRKMEF